MRIPVEWLGEYVDLSGVSAEKLSEALNLSGTENEIISGDFKFEKVVVGEILEIEKHPNADRLNVTQTKVGDKILQIVCGAPNIEVGQKVPVALVGAVLGEFEIKEAEIRGIKSHGMLCSESELGLSDDHGGIMILDSRSKVGHPLSEALSEGGVVIEAELTPNRADCFSIIGIAREAAATLDKKLKNLNFEKKQIASPKKVEVEVKEKELCPRYVTKVVEGVKIGPSPKWLADRLASAGVRSINNVVDVTNYVMLEWGQPMHAFDIKKIEGKIVVRLAKEGEELTTLDSAKRKLTRDDLVIADAKKAIALAGVMGGQNSEVEDGTTTIVLEAAVFNGTNVRRSAQRQGIRTEASNRFEKGIPLSLPELAIERAAGLITEIAGGSCGENTDVLSSWIWLQHVGLRRSKIKNFLGVEIPDEKVISILTSLGFAVEKFDFKKEARKHVGKPYILGARFKTHGDMAFDCSYLTDYIYSLIGQFVGYTSLAQFELGQPVENEDLKPGDVLFVKGHIDKSVTTHYFIPDGKGGYQKIELDLPKEVGHNALYIGGGRIIHARHFEYDQKKNAWTKGKEGKVVEEDVEVFTQNPEYLGAKRFIADTNDWFAVTVPWWRLDQKIEEDLLEELIRIYGYDNLISSLPKGEPERFKENKKVKVTEQIRDILAEIGFSEVVNYSFISEKQAKSIGADPKKMLKIANPISSEQEYMRTSLVPSLLSDATVNQVNYADFRLFEIAASYAPAKTELPLETTNLGFVVRSKEKGTKSFYEAKGALELIAEKLNISEFEFRTASVEFLEQGQAAKVYFLGEEMGCFGMISDAAKEKFSVKSDLCVGEISLEKVIQATGADRQYKGISRYPKSERDINLVFAKKVPAESIVKEIIQLKVPNLEKHEIIDIFTGKALAENEKSVTIRLVFGSEERTLEEAEVAGGVTQVAESLKKKLGAKERII